MLMKTEEFDPWESGSIIVMIYYYNLYDWSWSPVDIDKPQGWLDGIGIYEQPKIMVTTP